MDLNFASDNATGASPPVLQALIDANAGSLPAYGQDLIAREVEQSLAAIFERDVSVFLVATGTAANALALAAALTPWGLCLCHEEAHVIDDECGAPEFFSHGAKLLGLPGTGGKLAPETLRGALDRLPNHEKQMPAQAVSISQATEAGLVYGLDEIARIGAICRERGLALHMDGARFANALVALGASPAEMTWRRGVDILSFGGTKNGCLAAEAIVVFDPRLAETLRFRRKRSGHTLSKGRLLSAQFRGYLADDHWLANARAANARARELADGLAAVPGVRLAWPREANEVFPILPGSIAEALRGIGAVFYPWASRSLPAGTTLAPGDTLARFVASFATAPEAVRRVVETAWEAATPARLPRAASLP